MRRVLFWLHLGAGVLAGILIIFFAVTGSLLGYERQIVHAADRRAYAADPTQGNAARMPLDDLLAQAAPSMPAPVESLTLYQDPSLPVEIGTAGREVYFADPHTGKVQGPQSPRLRAFFAQVTALHRWFGLSNAHHATATAVKGVVALLFLFQLLSGAVLWLPVRWSGSSLAPGHRARIRQARPAPQLQLAQGHRLLAWYPPRRHRSYRGGHGVSMGQCAALSPGAQPPAGALGTRPRVAVNAGGHPTPTHLDQAFTQATSLVPGWRSATLRLSGAPGLNFVVDRGDGGHPEQRTQILVHPRTLQVLRTEPFAALSRGQRWRSWVRFTHTGEAGGWWGETLALITSCGAILLSLTGLALSFDRLRRWQRMKKTAPQLTLS